MITKNNAAIPADVLPTLRNLRSSLEILNKAVILAEAVDGVRLLEPRNDLSQELKEINWCIARISGSTWREEPPAREVKGVPASQRRIGTDPGDHPV